MKTDRRHELQKNQLADVLGHGIEAAKPYSRLILGALIALLVAVFAYLFISGRAAARSAEAWEQYYEARSVMNREKLHGVVKDYPDTPAADWARLTLADIRLSEGVNGLFQDKSDAKSDLKEAVEIFEDLRSSEETLVQQRALFGLARAQESLGNLKEARGLYEALLQEYPMTPFRDAAERRIELLGQASTQEFYEWFGKYEPTPPPTEGPGIPGLKPDFDLLEESRRGVTPPVDFGQPLIPEVKEGTSGAEAEEQPAAEGDSPETPAATEQPAADDNKSPESATPPADADDATTPATNGTEEPGAADAETTPDAAEPAEGGTAAGNPLRASGDAAPPADNAPADSGK